MDADLTKEEPDDLKLTKESSYLSLEIDRESSKAGSINIIGGAKLYCENAEYSRCSSYSPSKQTVFKIELLTKSGNMNVRLGEEKVTFGEIGWVDLCPPKNIDKQKEVSIVFDGASPGEYTVKIYAWVNTTANIFPPMVSLVASKIIISGSHNETREYKAENNQGRKIFMEEIKFRI